MSCTVALLSAVCRTPTRLASGPIITCWTRVPSDLPTKTLLDSVGFECGIITIRGPKWGGGNPMILEAQKGVGLYTDQKRHVKMT